MAAVLILFLQSNYYGKEPFKRRGSKEVQKTGQ